jgi:hypothetical protein
VLSEATVQCWREHSAKFHTFHVIPFLSFLILVEAAARRRNNADDDIVKRNAVRTEKVKLLHGSSSDEMKGQVEIKLKMENY